MEQPESSPDPSPIRVLHVDDEVSQLDYTKAFLEQADETLHVESVASPEEALEQLGSESFDCVVSDFQMPGLDGIELARRIRETSDIPFIIYTGRGSEEVAEAAFTVGIDDYIRKEVNPSHYSVLVRRIRSAVEERKAVEALIRAEERYRTLLESGMDAVAITMEQEFAYINKTFVEMLGYADPSELIGRRSSELVDPRDQERLEEITERRKRGEKQRIIYNLRILKKDGSSIWLEISSIGTEFEGKRASISNSRDITDRKQMEEEIRNSEERYRSLVENSPTSISVTVGSEIAYVNRRRAELTGHTRSELVGTNGIDNIVPEDVELIQSRIKARERGEKVPDFLEFELMAKGGKTVRVIDYDSNITWQGSDAVMHMMQNVTHSREMEKEIRESDAEKKAILEAIPDAISLKDIDYRFIWVNDVLAGTVGRAAEDLVGETCYEVSYGRAEPCEDCSFRIVMETGETARGAKVFADGRTWESAVTPIRDDSGEMVAALEISREVTERKRMEEGLRRSNEEKTAVLEGSADAIVVNDSEKFVYLNQKAVELFGYTDSSELVGKPFLDFFTFEHQDIIRTRAKERLKGETPPSQYEVLIQRGDGSVVPVEFHVSVIEFNAKPAILNVIRDITERKQMEEEIESLARFPSENTSPVMRVSEDGVVLYANAASESLLGEWGTAVGEKAPEEWRCRVSKVLLSGLSEEVEIQYGIRLLSFMLMPVVDSGYVNIYGGDITERRRYEESLEALHIHALGLNTGQSVEEVYSFTLEAMERALGFDRVDILMVEGGFLRKVATNERLPGEVVLSLDGKGLTVKAVQEKRSILINDVREDEDFVWIVDPSIVEANLEYPSSLSELVSPIIIDGEAVGVLNVESLELGAFSSNDLKLLEILADHVASAMRRIQSQQRLDDQKEQHSRELVDGVQRVSSMVRHDIRGPLQTIMNASYVARKEPEKLEEMMDIIKESIKHANDIMEDWRNQETPDTLTITEVDLSQLISDSLSASLIPSEVEVEVNAGPLKHSLDKVRMRRVLDNLIRNAIEAMKNDGRLTISARESGDEIIIEVSDTGIGIPETELGNLFKPFYTTKPHGVGLGLAYCRRTVEAHGGTITVESVEGEGTTLRITLPCQRDS